MVIHVGINPWKDGETTVIIYDTDSCLTNEFLFNKSDYCNDIRKNFISSALKYGFKKVSIVDEFIAVFLEAIIQVKHLPKNLNFIWIIESSAFSIWENYNNQTTILYKSYKNHFDKILSSLNEMDHEPDLILYFVNDFTKIQKTFFQQCPSFVCQPSQKCMNGILTDARITANDPKFGYLNIGKKLCNEYTIEMGIQRLIKIEYHEMLPSQKIIIFSTNERDNILRIWAEVSNNMSEQSICLPVNKKFLLTLKIDIYKIFSIHLQILSTSDEFFTLVTKNTITKQCFYIPKGIKNVLMSQNFQESNEIVGIDLGTSRCCVAVSRKNGIETVALDNQGQRLLPSYVAFDEKVEKCGQLVINRLQHHAKSTIFDLKRIMGKNFEDTLHFKNSWPFKVIDKTTQMLALNNHKNLQFQLLEKNNIIIQFHSYNGIANMHPEEIAAVLLKHIGRKIQEFQAVEYLEAVIAIPSGFTDAQKDATRIAANLAGWQRISFLPEPVAAAFAYFIDKPIPNNSTVLLLDIGGGTLDICIFKIINEEICIIGNYGDSGLGGRDFDNVLFEYDKHKLFKLYGISLSSKKYYKLLTQCQNIKENLSTCYEDVVDVEEYDPTCEGFLTITREEFECILIELLDQIKISISNALDKVKYQEHQINQILLVGGSCRMPVVQKLVQQKFPIAEYLCHEILDELVAIGAAYVLCSLFNY